METLNHLLHAAIIGIMLYALMVYILKQNVLVATNRSILIASILLIYMIYFGHSFPPGKMNPDIF